MENQLERRNETYENLEDEAHPFHFLMFTQCDGGDMYRKRTTCLKSVVKAMPGWVSKAERKSRQGKKYMKAFEPDGSPEYPPLSQKTLDYYEGGYK